MSLTSAEEETVAQAARLAAAVFQITRWTWGDKPGYVPDEARIASTLTRLAMGAKDTEGSSSSGRFHVTYGTDDPEYQPPWLSISLDLADSEALS